MLRHDPGTTLTGPIERSAEADVLTAAHAAGVATPRVRFVLEPADQLGTGFVMDRVAGETVPRRILRDDAYASARPRLAAQCGEAARGSTPCRPPRCRPSPSWARSSSSSSTGRSSIRSVSRTRRSSSGCAASPATRRPSTSRRSCTATSATATWSSGPTGSAAVLDWELAHLGDPAEDLGWLCVKSWRFGETEHPVGGFGDVADLTAAYEAAGGRPADPARLRWWESFGTLKWGVICEIQAQTHLQGLVRSVELATLGRRIAEMEWDLLELLADDQPVPAESPARLGTDPRAARPDSLQDRPSAPELVAAVREFLERDVVGTIEGRVGFHARVATNALGIVERELVLGPGLDAAARDRLATFLGHDTDLGTLLGELASRIRDGALDDDPEAFAVTRDTVRSKLEVSNPRYATGPA